MKKTTLTTWALGILMALTACSAEDPIESYYNQYENTPGAGGPGGFMGGSTGSATVGSGELVSFDIALDKTTAEPTTAVAEYFPEEEDNLDNNSFTTQVNIDLSNPTAKTENGVTVTMNEGHITANHGTTKNICYVVSGTTDNGSFTVMGDKKYEIVLNGATIVNPDSAALNLLSGKRAYIVLADGTSNKLTDGTSSKNSHKGTLYCKGKLLFNGSGSLEVYGNYANAIHSADYIVFRKGNNIYAKSTAKNGIKANDGIFINGGILNVEVSAAGAKGINCEDDIIINGGRTSVIATGNGTWDTDELETKAAAAIKSDSILTVNGGELYLKATGSGGKGLKADWEAYINGGKMRIITTGNLYYSNGTTENHNYTGNTDNLADAYTSSPKGIKVGTKNVHGVLNITGGDIMVRTSGNNAEGIESKGTLTITSGDIQVSAHDDAINSSSDLTISGGNVVAVGTSNDGIDTNGNMYIKGGTLIAIGAGGAETGIDIDEQHKLYISGGNIFGIGGRIDGSIGSTTQGIATTSGSIQANGTVTIANASTTLATFNMPPYSYNNGSILVSAPGMTSGSSYTLNLGSQSKTITAANTINSRF